LRGSAPAPSHLQQALALPKAHEPYLFQSGVPGGSPAPDAIALAALGQPAS